MAKIRLTDPMVKALKPGESLSDSLVPSLTFRRLKSGGAWLVIYRPKNQPQGQYQQRRPKIGDWPDMNVASARDAAKALLGRVANGEDPSGAARSAKLDPTVADLLDAFERIHLPKRKPSTRAMHKFNGKIIRRAWPNRLASSIRRADAAELHAGMESPYVANRVLATISKAWNFGIYTLEWSVGANPASRLERNKEEARTRLPDLSEARAIGRAIAARELTHPDHITALKLLLLTAARRNEIMKARAEWVTARGLQLPTAASKTGFKVVALSSMARAEIAALGRVTGRLFPFGRKSFDEFWHGVRREAGCPDLILHDFRRMFGQLGIDAGITLDQLGGIFGHSDPRVTQKHYAWMSSAGKTATAETVGGMIIDALAEPIEPKRLPPPSAAE